jgi:hypothetical protein
MWFERLSFCLSSGDAVLRRKFALARDNRKDSLYVRAEPVENRRARQQ